MAILAIASAVLACFMAAVVVIEVAGWIGRRLRGAGRW
jgi:hypothetical protein